MTERIRFIGKHQKGGIKETPQTQQTFVNPYSYESSPEARVQLELEARQIRFAYRYFADSTTALRIHKMVPDFAPEFTLPDYKVVIMIEGDFFGSLPGVLDKLALESVLLQADGWKAVVWAQSEIMVDGVGTLMHRDLPQMDIPAFRGAEIPSPYGRPSTWDTKRAYLRGLALLRKLFGNTVKDTASTDERKRKSYLRRSTGNGGRRRLGHQHDGPNYE